MPAQITFACRDSAPMDEARFVLNGVPVAMGMHSRPHLRPEAVNLLDMARERVADFVEGPMSHSDNPNLG